MKMFSLKERSELYTQALYCCKAHWNAVYDSFRTTAERSLTAELLPQTWLLMGGSDDTDILGFYQLVSNDGLTQHTELYPFVATLFVHPRYRGGHGIGEMLLTHAKYETARLGYEKLYVCTDHIGYYEKYGFYEIGLDTPVWGGACKIYCCDTPTEITLRRFDRQHSKNDNIHLELASARWNISEKNPSLLLHRLKHSSFPECYDGRWHQIIAFHGHNIVGAVNFMRDNENAMRWYLGDLFVVSEYRRRGIAKRLIRYGINEIRRTMSGNEYIHSYICSDNAASQELHKALGFADLGKLLPFDDFIFDKNNTTWELRL